MNGEPESIFENNDLRAMGPYIRREIKLEVVDGVPRVVEHIYQQGTAPDGVLTIVEGQRYLCQSCGTAWIVLGSDGFCWKKTVLCRKCLRRATLKWLLKPLWSLFVKTEE